jgi:hypothetical protein
MQSYDSCRKLLAADKANMKGCAAGISTNASAVMLGASDKAKPHAQATKVAADALAKLGADDIEKVRLAFGEVSRGMVALLKASPDEAKKYHVFECPMAKGYKRWAQIDGELKNPYMGSKMLSCGSKVALLDEGGDDAKPGDMKAGDMKGMKKGMDHGKKGAMDHNKTPMKKGAGKK